MAIYKEHSFSARIASLILMTINFFDLFWLLQWRITEYNKNYELPAKRFPIPAKKHCYILSSGFGNCLRIAHGSAGLTGRLNSIVSDPNKPSGKRGKASEAIAQHCKESVLHILLASELKLAIDLLF
jgi:hypothetical protein